MDWKLFITGDIDLSRADFGNKLVDEVAFDIAFLLGMKFGSKEGLLEVVYKTAEGIIEKVRR